MTIEEMQKEIERLKKSPNVKRALNGEKQKLQRQLYRLRYLEKQGKALAEQENVSNANVVELRSHDYGL